jgi:serine/threonine protein kinase
MGLLDVDVLNPDNCPTINRLFQQYKATQCFLKHQPYEVNGQSIRLNHPIILKDSSESNNCEYIVLAGESLGFGGYGTVFLIKAKLQYNAVSKALERKKEEKQQVIKLISGPEHEKIARDEAKYSAKTPHLGVTAQSAFTYIHDRRKTHALIMNRFEGQDLEQYLRREKGKDSFNWLKRLKLTKAILLAYQNQVFDKELIHRDLKPENIMVDEQGDEFVINIIDYGLACSKKSSDEKRKKSCGTRLFKAPEVLKGSPATNKADIFSLGCTLLETFNAKESCYYPRREAEKQKLLDDRKNGKITCYPLFTNNLAKGVKAEDKELLSNLIHLFLMPNPAHRPTAKAAIETVSFLINKQTKPSLKTLIELGLNRYVCSRVSSGNKLNSVYVNFLRTYPDPTISQLIQTVKDQTGRFGGLSPDSFICCILKQAYLNECLDYFTPIFTETNFREFVAYLTQPDDRRSLTGFFGTTSEAARGCEARRLTVEAIRKSDPDTPQTPCPIKAY